MSFTDDSRLTIVTLPTIIRLAFIFLALSTTLSCSKPFTAAGIIGSGITETEKRSFPQVDQIKIKVAAQVKISKGPSTIVEITTDDNILPAIKTELIDQTLVVKLSNSNSVSSAKGIIIEITTQNIRYLETHGSGNLKLISALEDHAKLFLKGSGSIEAVGDIERLDASLDGSGSLKLKQLMLRTCILSIRGSGKAEISSTDRLDVSINGSGKTTYFGNPKETNFTVKGSGKIRKG